MLLPLFSAALSLCVVCSSRYAQAAYTRQPLGHISSRTWNSLLIPKLAKERRDEARTGTVDRVGDTRRRSSAATSVDLACANGSLSCSPAHDPPLAMDPAIPPTSADRPVTATSSVRVRRGTVSSRPPVRFDPPSLPRGTLHPDDELPPLSEQPDVPAPVRRRRAATLTQRLFADEDASEFGLRGRTRASSNASGGSGAARAAAPVIISMGDVERPGSPKGSGRRRGSSAAGRMAAADAIDEQHHAEQEVDVVSTGYIGGSSRS